MLFYSLISIVYILFTAVLLYAWLRMPSKNRLLAADECPELSVVVVVRNEERNIASLLNSLRTQAYPTEKLQLLFINDASTDATVELIQQATLDFPFPITIQDLVHRGGAFKKEAISQAIAFTRSEIILTTDGDCQMGPQWVMHMVSTWKTRQLKMVVGPVAFIDHKHWFARWQNIEFAALTATGAASLYFKKPSMCNGANLLYSKAAFYEVGGFDDVAHIASGDDELLMHKMAQKWPDGVGFLKNEEGLVLTNPQTSIRSFWHQRRRWSGKWKYYQLAYIKVLALFIFIYHATVLIALVACWAGWGDWKIWMGGILGKMLIEYALLSNVTRFAGKTMSLWAFAFSSLFYSVYAVIFGIASNFGRYTWKGRAINQGKYERSGV